MNGIISEKIISDSLTYPAYKELVERLASEGKTTGINPPEKYAEYTKLNAERMKRIGKTVTISNEIAGKIGSVVNDIILLVIAESWCGDVAQNLPVIWKLSEINPRLDLRIILRDENDNLMQNFLTDGGRSIPVCLIIDKNSLYVLGKWGPRPEPAQRIIREHKANPDRPYSEVSKEIQLWYTADRGQTVQKEIVNLLESILTD